MKILRKTAEIFKSGGIALDPTHEQFELAQERIKICNTCEFKKEDPVIHCSVCGCALKAKIYTPNTFLDIDGSCPKEKWKDIEAKWLMDADKTRYDSITGLDLDEDGLIDMSEFYKND